MSKASNETTPGRASTLREAPTVRGQVLMALSFLVAYGVIVAPCIRGSGGGPSREVANLYEESTSLRQALSAVEPSPIRLHPWEKVHKRLDDLDASITELDGRQRITALHVRYLASMGSLLVALALVVAGALSWYAKPPKAPKPAP